MKRSLIVLALSVSTLPLGSVSASAANHQVFVFAAPDPALGELVSVALADSAADIRREMSRVTSKWASATMVVQATAGSAVAQDVFNAQATYTSGKDGFGKKIEGRLVLGAQEIRFMAGSQVLFVIPLSGIANATNSSDVAAPGWAVRGLGVWAPRTITEEYVYVTTESATVAEVVVFRLQKKTAAGLAAKIEFAIKHAKGGA
jgi:hypothetical protein